MEKISAIFSQNLGNKTLYPALNNMSLFLYGSGWNKKEYIEKWCGDNIRLDLLLLMQNGFAEAWLSSEDDLRRVGYDFFCDYLQDRVVLGTHTDAFWLASAEMDRLYTIYSYENIQSLIQQNKIAEAIKTILDTIWNTNACLLFTVFFDKDMCKTILKDCGVDMAESRLNKIWNVAVLPTSDSFLVEKERYIYDVYKKHGSFDCVSEPCQFFYTDFYTGHNLLGVADKIAQEYGLDIKSGELFERIKRYDAEQQENKESIKRLGHSLSEKEKKVLLYINSVITYRDKRKNFFAKGLTVLYRIAEVMFEKAEIDIFLIPYYTVAELAKGVDYLISQKDALKSRTKGVMCYSSFDEENTCIYDDVHATSTVLKKMQIEKNKNNFVDGLLRGQGCGGKTVFGRVKIVKDPKQCDINPNEVLVTGMTRPEFVPLMKKAVAIITDEGGVTCHAAVISRELGKSCVVGTKIATHTLQDGDLVEVDANTGVVKIIEKTK
tara:strand:+ start:1531 stop:3006 length:1476 start_codon:yes stop_codon:yes gene_type:complete